MITKVNVIDIKCGEKLHSYLKNNQDSLPRVGDTVIIEGSQRFIVIEVCHCFGSKDSVQESINIYVEC